MKKRVTQEEVDDRMEKLMASIFNHVMAARKEHAELKKYVRTLPHYEDDEPGDPLPWVYWEPMIEAMWPVFLFTETQPQRAWEPLAGHIASGLKERGNRADALEKRVLDALRDGQAKRSFSRKPPL